MSFIFFLFIIDLINHPSYKLIIIITLALINKNMMNDRYICTSIVRDCCIKDTRDLSCIFLFLSGFVRYTRKPKDNKNLFLLSLAFGKLNKTDKIKIGKGLKVEIF